MAFLWVVGFMLIETFYNDTKRLIVKASLFQIRTMIVLYRTQELFNGRDAYPVLEWLQNKENIGRNLMMIQEGLPENLFSTGSDRRSVELTRGRPQPRGTKGAWAYDSYDGGFYANTASGAGEEKY